MRRIVAHTTSALLLAIVAGVGCGRSPNLLGQRGPEIGDAGGGGAGTGGFDAGGATDGPPADAAQADPGRVLMHRLTNVEYDNTVRDLLGVTTSPAAGFQADETDEATGGFDNLAENLHTYPARYQRYFDAAKTLADAAWADPKLQARIVTCAPDAQGQCARKVIAAFGLRAWRRPLTDGEAASLGAMADATQRQTGDASMALKRVVTAMLSSLPFLYKIELDPDPASATPHPLSGYELASRLSYLLWSSMPDDELLKLGDGLGRDDVLDAQLDRMLADPRAEALSRNFAGQWLGIRELAAHAVAARVYHMPTWDDALRQSMVTETSLYFDEFLDRSFGDFLTADLHFVDRRLATHYRLQSPPAGADFERVALVPARHLGFLGLAGFQTLTSLPYRTSPSKRGSWIAQHLLCDTRFRSPHFGTQPPLDVLAIPVDPRKALEQTLNQPDCAACHATFDGMGFALEGFDAIGLARSAYSPTDPLNTSGTLADGTTVDGPTQLAATLARDPRLATCAARKTLSYALGRVLEDADRDRIDGVIAAWRGGTLRELLRTIVRSDTFRFRRGEGP